MQIPHVDGLHVTHCGPGPFHLRKPLDQELRNRRQHSTASANFHIFCSLSFSLQSCKADKADADDGHVTIGKCSLAD